jgi:hypothetical protein
MRSGEFASSNATLAFALPSFAHSWSLDFLAAITAVWDNTKIPLARISNTIMRISNDWADIRTSYRGMSWFTHERSTTGLKR